jgi:gamma-glutamyl:cysteine ligase YbdK (ATP-grasp superfamily)
MDMGKGRKTHRLSLGYEWETILLNKYGIPPKSEEMAPLVSKIRKEIPLCRVGFDWIPGLQRSLFEIRSGIVHNREELEERTRELLRLIIKFSKKENFRFLPIGSYPPMGSAVGFHIHTGSWESTEGLFELANNLIPYAPCFAALSVNSPLWGTSPLNPPLSVKSYRIKHHAQLMSPPSYSDPAFSFLSWEPDITVKFLSHPTIELRICDTPLSYEFANELTAFVSSFIIELKKHPIQFNKKTYIEGIDNRLRAMKDGLQALFLWKEKEREVTDILKEMIKIAEPTLKKIGYNDLPLIKRMLFLKQTQADLLSFLFKHYKGDVIDFTNYLSSGLNWLDDPFKTYLAFAPELKTKELMDIDEYLLSMIGKRSKYGSLYDVLHQPTKEFEKRIWKLKENNLIDITFDEEKGLLFSNRKK